MRQLTLRRGVQKLIGFKEESYKILASFSGIPLSLQHLEFVKRCQNLDQPVSLFYMVTGFELDHVS